MPQQFDARSYPVADLTTLEGLAEVLEWVIHGRQAVNAFTGTFCPSCGAARRMELTALYWEGEAAAQSVGRFNLHAAANVPALFELTCLECHSTITVLLYRGPDDDVGLVALPRSYGGISTPNTPEGVSYYLDQAQRAQAVGANSAAVAMYRAALEHLLFQHGYTQRMLGPKLDAIKADSSAPEWYRRLDPAYLAVLGALGNAAIHPNDGDVKRQAALNGRLLQLVRQLFVELLDAAYERPEHEAARLGEMREALAAFHEDPAPPTEDPPPTAEPAD
jgi:hypothetical protein